MKKLLFAVMLSMFFVSTAHAGLITISVLSDDSQVSYTYLNNSFNTVKNCINGNIESVNIKDATITVDDIASSASPAQREGDHFNPYTKTGMLPATSTAPDLFSDISAGTSYVESDAGLLYRVVTAATSHTYTASKDTWVYIDINGAFQYSIVTVGAAQPATPSNSLLLANVTTDADNITTVTDYRVTTISFGATEDFYVKGMRLLWDQATDRTSVDNGIIRVGSSTVTKTSPVGLNIGTAGDYITGVSERAVSKWLHIYSDSSGNIKLDDNAPDYHNTSGTTTGKLRYYKNGTTYWRYVGSIRLNATGSGNINGFRWDGEGDYVNYFWDVPVSITTTVSAGVWSAATSCSAAMPATSTLALFGVDSRHVGSQCGIWLRPNGYVFAVGNENGIVDSAGNEDSGQLWSATDNSQQIQTYNDPGDTSTQVDLEAFVILR